MTVRDLLRRELELHLPPAGTKLDEAEIVIQKMINHLKAGGDRQMVIDRIKQDEDDGLLWMSFHDSEDIENKYTYWEMMEFAMEAIEAE